MIRVIKHGKPIYTVECRNCSCLFQFAQDDIVEESSSKGEYVSIRCPDCNNRITSWSSKDWLKKVLE